MPLVLLPLIERGVRSALRRQGASWRMVSTQAGQMHVYDIPGTGSPRDATLVVMHGIGVCTIGDIALSVLATVIGHKPEKGWILVDAGWMALSRDRGTARHPVDQGYGVVCDVDGDPYPDLIVVDTSQEHGIVAVRPGSRAPLPSLPIGTRVRILPNHACATGSQHDRYHVVRAGSRRVADTWPRMRGW